MSLVGTSQVSRGCAELASPLTSSGALENRPHLSPVITLQLCTLPKQPSRAGRGGGVWVSRPQGMSVGEPTHLP